MAPSRIQKALGAVKDKTSIGLAKVSSNSNAVSDLEVAVVKATRHDENPADERHIREILSLTCYSRQYVTACVNTIARRLTKTRSWTVALKSLVLLHRLLIDGDPAYEQEVFFATRRGTRLLNMSDFRDVSRSGCWDFSAFVRTFARYLDERLEYRVLGRRDRKGRRCRSFTKEEEGSEDGGGSSSSVTSSSGRTATPVKELKTERVFNRVQHLLRLLERFLACRPTGVAKNSRIVAVALYPLVKESHQLYYELVEITAVLVDRFVDLTVPDCVKVFDIFSHLSKLLEELDSFYSWCKSVGISRSSEFPDIDHITQKKLDVMDQFIRDKSAVNPAPPQDDPEPAAAVRALPPPEVYPPPPDPEPPASADEVPEPDAGMQLVPVSAAAEEEEEVDFLNLRLDSVAIKDNSDKLALALFDDAAGRAADAPPPWEAFAEEQDWETALVLSTSALPRQRPSLGGSLDLMTLDAMYREARPAAAPAGSASSVAAMSGGASGLLALPAPTPGWDDPFAASTAMPPPPYVQMSDMEKKQKLLAEEQAMWQQYSREGMQGAAALAKAQRNPYFGIGNGSSYN